MNDNKTYINVDVHVMFTQMQASGGLKIFGKISVASMVKY